MEALKKWLVGLDLTDHDHSILKYTKLLSDVFHPESIEFVYIAHRLPDSVHVHLPDALKYPSYDVLLEKLKKEVYSYFSENDLVNSKILDGPVQFDLWRESYLKEIDLFIAGSKPKHKGRGLIPNKFVRKSFCSVLFIPENAPEHIGKIWVPTDFSDSSADALGQAFYLARGLDPPAEVCAHHVYQLPHAFYYEGFPRDEIMRAVRLDAENQCQELVKKYDAGDISITSCFTELYQSYAANNIKQEAERNEADLILMASGGRSRFSRFLLGSETEKLVQIEKQVPLMVLKKKADHVKLWDLASINN